MSGSWNRTITRWDRRAQLHAGGSGSSLVCSSMFDYVLFSAPTDMVCAAMNLDRQLFVFRLENGGIAIRHRVT